MFNQLNVLLGDFVKNLHKWDYTVYSLNFSRANVMAHAGTARNEVVTYCLTNFIKTLNRYALYRLPNAINIVVSMCAGWQQHYNSFEIDSVSE